MDSFEFIYLGQCVPKGRPRFARMGKRVKTYTDKKTSLFESNVSRLFKVQFGGFFPFSVPIGVEINFVIERPIKPKFELPAVRVDLDNLTKSVLDSLNKIAWRDDSLICDLKVSKNYGEPGFKLKAWKL